MRFIKSLLQFFWFIFLGTMIRPGYKFFRAWFYERDKWVDDKLSDWNYFKKETK